MSTEYKVSDIVKMLSLVESFTSTYDSEAVQTRKEISQITSNLGETRVMTNCLEQKLHYIERELNLLTSAMPKRPKKYSEDASITEVSSEYYSSASKDNSTFDE